MATVAPSSSPVRSIPLTRPQWIFLSLLVISICINYIDRGSLSVAEKYLRADFGLDAVHLGWLYSAFFMTYAAFQLLAGWLADRFNVNRVLAGGFLIWSTAMLLTGTATSFWMIFAFRLALGVGESVAYPSYSKILARNFEEHQRGFANAAIDAGCKIGPALGIFAGGLFMGAYGWRVFFYITGGLSLLWIVPWSIWAPKAGATLREAGQKAPRLGEICARRSAWGSFLGLFCGNYVWYFILTWLPGYFVRELHYTQSQMAVFGSIPLAVVAISTLFFGWLSDRWIASGASPNRVRKTFTGLGLGLSTVMLLAATLRDPVLSLVLLSAACFAYGAYSSNLWAITQTLAGPTAAGRWTGAQNFAGNLSGVVAPSLTGWIVQTTGQFYWAFAIATMMLLIGAFAFVVLVKRVVPEDWNCEEFPYRFGRFHGVLVMIGAGSMILYGIYLGGMSGITLGVSGVVAGILGYGIFARNRIAITMFLAAGLLNLLAFTVWAISYPAILAVYGTYLLGAIPAIPVYYYYIRRLRNWTGAIPLEPVAE